MKRLAAFLTVLLLLCQAACAFAAADVTSIVGARAFETRAELLVVALVCVALFAVVIVLVILILRKKRPPKPAPEPCPLFSMDGLNIAEDNPITLVIDYAGGSTHATYTLEEGVPLLIGRASDADIHLSKDDLLVARHHGKLVYRGGMLHYQNYSKCGTYVDGQLICNADCTLQPGSVLEMGKHRIKIEKK